jgi:glucoamylase
MLSNGSLLVGLNGHGLVHDFYYPYVGLENLTTARSVHHNIGVWVDGRFSWVDREHWKTHITYGPNALISEITIRNDELLIELQTRDQVDPEFNVFERQIEVKNLGATKRDIRLFMHQVFQISNGGRADTALYEPEEGYIFDYKGRVALLIYGQDGQGRPCDQYAVGGYGIEGKEGTFRDAEDGELSNSPVEHGGVDSVMRFSMQLEPHSAHQISYWIVASDSQTDAEAIHLHIKREGLTKRFARAENIWHDWFAISANALHQIEPQYLDAVKRSMLVIKAHIDKHGGILASGDSSIYNYGRDYYSYVWPRDGAYVVWPLIRMGYKDEPRNFFQFCRDTAHKDGYMMHKYQPDRAVGSTWHPLVHGRRKELAIQEDETAIVVYMIGEYVDRHKEEEHSYLRELYHDFVKKAADFMATFIDETTGLPHASYDLWEEKFATHTYTVAVVIAALHKAAEMAVIFGEQDKADYWHGVANSIESKGSIFFDGELQSYIKSFLLQENDEKLFDKTIDSSSAYGIMVYGKNDGNAALAQSMAMIEQHLRDQSPSGGVIRYENDNYFLTRHEYKGNPWSVCTLWLAQYYIRTNRIDEAKALMDWTLLRALPSGVVSEQVDPLDGHAIGVAPLVWSHAEFVTTALYLSEK